MVPSSFDDKWIKCRCCKIDLNVLETDIPYCEKCQDETKINQVQARLTAAMSNFNFASKYGNEETVRQAVGILPEGYGLSMQYQNGFTKLMQFVTVIASYDPRDKGEERYLCYEKVVKILMETVE